MGKRGGRNVIHRYEDARNNLISLFGIEAIKGRKFKNSRQMELIYEYGMRGKKLRRARTLADRHIQLFVESFWLGSPASDSALIAILELRAKPRK